MSNSELTVKETKCKNIYFSIFKASLIFFITALIVSIYVFDSGYIIDFIQKCFYSNSTINVEAAHKIDIYLVRAKIYFPMALISYFTWNYCKDYITKIIKNNIKKIGFIFTVVGLLLILNYGFIYSIIMEFAVKNFSPDNYIPETNMTIILISSIIFILALGMVSVSDGIQNRIKQYIYGDRYDFNSSIYELPIVIGLSLVLLYYTRNIHFEFLFYEDNLFETISTLLYILSVSFLICSFNKMNRKEVLLGMLCSLILIFLFLEEISFGQRIFNIESFGIFKYNYQKEINFHNFLNPYFDYVYPLFGVMFFSVNILLHNKSFSNIAGIYSPHNSLIPLVVLILINSIGGQTELVEELLAVFMFFYSLRIYLITKPRCLQDKNVTL